MPSAGRITIAGRDVTALGAEARPPPTTTVFQGAHYRVVAAGTTQEQSFILRLPPRAAPAVGEVLTLSCEAEDLVAV